MRVCRLGRWPLCSWATFHPPFCCTDSLVGHSPVSYSLSLSLCISNSAVASGNACLHSLLNQAGVVLAIQGTPHQREKSNCCWAIVFHFISHTQRALVTTQWVPWNTDSKTPSWARKANRIYCWPSIVSQSLFSSQFFIFYFCTSPCHFQSFSGPLLSFVCSSWRGLSLWHSILCSETFLRGYSTTGASNSIWVRKMSQNSVAFTRKKSHKKDMFIKLLF